MAIHNLKIYAQPFADLLSGAKTGEVRNDDRGFEVGDTVHLTCTDGQTMDRVISHIQRGYGLPDGICVLSYTRPAAPVEGLETLSVEMKRDYAFMIADPDGDYVTRSQSEAIFAAKDKEIERGEFLLREKDIQHRSTMEAFANDSAALTATMERLRDSSEPMACHPDEWTATEAVLAHLLINVVGVPDDVTYTPVEAQEIIERQLKQTEALETQLAAATVALTAIATRELSSREELREIARAALEAKS